MVTLRAGLTLRLTDVSTVLFGIFRLAGRHHARGRTGVRGFIGAWSGSPVTVLSDPPDRRVPPSERT